jgi:hypothetical protein
MPFSRCLVQGRGFLAPDRFLSNRVQWARANLCNLPFLSSLSAVRFRRESNAETSLPCGGLGGDSLPSNRSVCPASLLDFRPVDTTQSVYSFLISAALRISSLGCALSNPWRQSAAITIWINSRNWSFPELWTWSTKFLCLARKYMRSS